nr:hypothetical protein [Deinococcus planocerae]
MAQQGVGGAGLRGGAAPAQASAHPHGGRPDREGGGQGGGHPAPHRPQATGATSRHEERELVAAHARHEHPRGQGRGEPPGERDEQPVSGGVPVRVVHELEAVEVEHAHREGFRARPPGCARRARQGRARLLQHGHEARPVGQTGQPVVEGEVLQAAQGQAPGDQEGGEVRELREEPRLGGVGRGGPASVEGQGAEHRPARLADGNAVGPAVARLDEGPAQRVRKALRGQGEHGLFFEDGPPAGKGARLPRGLPGPPGERGQARRAHEHEVVPVAQRGAGGAAGQAFVEGGDQGTQDLGEGRPLRGEVHRAGVPGGERERLALRRHVAQGGQPVGHRPRALPQPQGRDLGLHPADVLRAQGQVHPEGLPPGGQLRRLRKRRPQALPRPREEGLQARPAQELGRLPQQPGEGVVGKRPPPGPSRPVGLAGEGLPHPLQNQGGVAALQQGEPLQGHRGRGGRPRRGPARRRGLSPLRLLPVHGHTPV